MTPGGAGRHGALCPGARADGEYWGMPAHPNLHRHASRVALWTLLALTVWLAAAQLFVIALSPTGYWQVPRIRAVKVTRLEGDPQNSFTDRVIVTEGPEQKVLRMLKAERAELAPGQDILVLDNVFASPVRPAQYRLSAARLFLQFGPLLIPLLLLGLWFEHRKPLFRPETAPLPDGQARRVLTDDFHHRANRHRTS